MRLYKRLYKASILAALMIILAACSSTSISEDPAAAYKGYTAQQLYVQGQQAMASRSFRNATKIFEALESLYPFGEYAEKSQLNLVYSYYKTGDYPSAEAAADQYIHVYPRSPNVDYAFYMKGLSELYSGQTWVQRAVNIDMSLRDLASPKQAFYDFRDLVQLFPSSQYAPDARKRMAYLRNLLAKHEIYIAKYYMKRHAYVAAANRANYVVSHYAHAPQVEDALIILVKANRALGLQQPADDAMRVLQENFPTSSFIKRR